MCTDRPIPSRSPCYQCRPSRCVSRGGDMEAIGKVWRLVGITYGTALCVLLHSTNQSTNQAIVDMSKKSAKQVFLSLFVAASYEWKFQEEKCLQEIRRLAKVEANKSCVDCPEKMPSYINFTHHTFVCTKCSGIQYVIYIFLLSML